jgi:hypothetical protein
MAKKDDLFVRVETLALPGDLKTKLNQLIERCPEDQIFSVETMIERYELNEKNALEIGIQKDPQKATHAMDQFGKDSNALVSSHVSKLESQKAESELIQELDEL